MSVFTNLILSCFASDQIDAILPWLKHYKNSSSTALLTVFSFEHILVFVVIALRLWFDTEPRWLYNYRHRQIHKVHVKNIKETAEKR